VDETYVKVAGVWRYVYRAVDQFGQVIDVLVSPRRDPAAARGFFERAIGGHGRPAEVVTDEAPSLLRALDELLPEVCHDTTQHSNNRIECAPRAAEGQVAADARPATGPDGMGGDPGPRFCPEPPTRPLRTGR